MYTHACAPERSGLHGGKAVELRFDLVETLLEHLRVDQALADAQRAAAGQ